MKMKKDILKAAILSIFFCIAMLSWESVEAQDKQKVEITLKNGEKVSGVVLEAVPDKYMKLELPDNTVRTINSSEISEIGTPKNTKSQARLSIIAGVNASYDVSKFGYLMVEPRIIAGVKIKSARIGAGVSYIYAPATLKPLRLIEGDYNKTLGFLPIFANFHYDFGKKKVKPAVNVSAGYPLSLTQKQKTVTDESFGQYYNTVKPIGIFYGGLNAGVTIAASDKLGVNIGINYTCVVFTNDVNSSYSLGGLGSYEFSLSKASRTLNGLGLTVNLIY